MSTQSRYREINGSIVGASMITNIFNRWGVCMTMAAAAGAYMASDQTDESIKNISKQVGVGLVAAGVSRLLGKVILKGEFDRNLVVDTEGCNHFSQEEMEQHRDRAAALVHHYEINALVHTTSVLTLPFQAIFALPVSAELWQNKMHLLNIADGTWTLMPRSSVQPVETPKQTLGG